MADREGKGEQRSIQNQCTHPSLPPTSWAAEMNKEIIRHLTFWQIQHPAHWEVGEGVVILLFLTLRSSQVVLSQDTYKRLGIKENSKNYGSSH